ncbi:unnamed protein product [Moneuplotes crassus]|uniref:Uncharacterized protein n=1 Tax=Euplotes crassus TaxID=5936 RepID=A0AAD1U870_EUPCR|nr:unnamed protein product [Moneuplotes crassus]
MRCNNRQLRSKELNTFVKIRKSDQDRLSYFNKSSMPHSKPPKYFREGNPGKYFKNRKSVVSQQSHEFKKDIESKNINISRIQIPFKKSSFIDGSLNDETSYKRHKISAGHNKELPLHRQLREKRSSAEIESSKAIPESFPSIEVIDTKTKNSKNVHKSYYNSFYKNEEQMKPLQPSNMQKGTSSLVNLSRRIKRPGVTASVLPRLKKGSTKLTIGGKGKIIFSNQDQIPIMFRERLK